MSVLIIQNDKQNNNFCVKNSDFFESRIQTFCVKNSDFVCQEFRLLVTIIRNQTFCVKNSDFFESRIQTFLCQEIRLFVSRIQTLCVKNSDFLCQEFKLPLT